MRKVAIFSLGALALFLILKLDWPWLIPVVTVCILLLRLVIPKEGNVNKTLITWVAAFAGVALTFVWLIGGFLYGIEEGRYAAIQPGSFFEFFFGTDLLKGFWAVILGVALAAMLFFDVLVPYAYQVAKNRYGDYEQYKGKERLAAQTALADIIGISQGTWIVKSGETEVLENPSGSLARFGGPGILIVQQGHAVILEISGKITRIVHSGITWLRAFERISMVVPLQTRVEHVVVRKLATQDGIILDSLEFSVFHRVERGSETTQVSDGQYIYDPSILVKQVWSPSGGDWREAVRSISSRSARDIVGRFTLVDLVSLSGPLRREFVNQLAARINEVTAGALGVSIIAVDVGEVEIPEETKKRLLEIWLAQQDQTVAELRAAVERINGELSADIDKMAIERRGEAQAIVLGQVEKVKAITRAEMIRQVHGAIYRGKQPVDDAIALKYFDAIERLSRTFVTDEIAALRYVDVLEKLSENEQSKVLVFGSPDRLFSGTGSTPPIQTSDKRLD